LYLGSRECITSALWDRFKI